jgi:hypothetical protein
LQDGYIQIYQFHDNDLVKTNEISKNRGEITCLSYSPNGLLLAASDTQRAVLVFDAVSKEVIIFVIYCSLKFMNGFSTLAE